MSFFYEEAKKTAKKPQAAKRRDIPIASLQKLGCSVCPRQESWPDLRSPKLLPTGDDRPLVYLLGTGPNEDEDEAGRHWVGVAGRAILSKFSKRLRASTRFGHLTQCMPPLEDNGERDLNVKWPEIECCRPRVVDDIERSKPLVIVGVGDKPLQWATSKLPESGTSMTFRGRFFPVKVGTHVCWFYPVMYPNWAFKKKKSYGISEYELALEHDLRNLEKLLDDEVLGTPRVYRSEEADAGVELITGQEPGDMQRLERALADLATASQTGVDIETNGLRPWRVKKPAIWTAAVGTFERTVAFAIDHPDGWGAASRISKVHSLFAEFLLFSNRKMAHNLAMEMEWCNFFYGPQAVLATEWGDTMAMAHTFDERPGTKSLEVQTILAFGFNLKAMSRVDPSRPNWINEYPIREVLRYNGMDSKWTDKLARHYEPIIKADGAAQWAEYERKVRLAPALVLTEAKGLQVNVGRAEDLDDKLAATTKEIDAKLLRCPEIRKFSSRFGVFDPGNDHQVLKLMQVVLDRPEIKNVDRDGKVSYSTDVDALSVMPKAEVPSASLILERRTIEKLRGTYLGPVISGKIVSEDGRVHSRYSSMVAVTGRLAAEDPNAQNWPKRKHREIRAVFDADEDEEVVACDYGQIEFRVVGMASEDTNLVKYCWTGYDVHQYWAQRMVDEYPKIKDIIVAEFEVDWDEKGLKTLRQESKNGWVFPQLFGSSLKSCAEQLHLPLEIAEDLGAEFWDEFRGVKKWQERLLKSYERNLYVETLGGRRRRGPMTKNEIINMPIQGTACDIVTEAHIALSHRAYIEDQLEYQPSLNVHDDLSSWLKRKTREERVQVIVREMCLPRFSYINVPLVVEVSVGPNWADLKEIAKYRSDELFNTRNPYK